MKEGGCSGARFRFQCGLSKREYPKPGLTCTLNNRENCPCRPSRPLDLSTSLPPVPPPSTPGRPASLAWLPATTINARTAPSYVRRWYFTNLSRNRQLTCSQNHFPCSDISALSSFLVSFPLSSSFLPSTLWALGASNPSSLPLFS